MDEKWEVGQAEFQGYVKAKLEENTEAHNTIFNKLDGQEKRLRNNENAVSILQVRSGVIATISAAIVLVGKWLWDSLK